MAASSSSADGGQAMHMRHLDLPAWLDAHKLYGEQAADFPSNLVLEAVAAPEDGPLKILSGSFRLGVATFEIEPAEIAATDRSKAYSTIFALQPPLTMTSRSFLAPPPANFLGPSRGCSPVRAKANPIGVAAYALQSELPGEQKAKLPTAKQLADIVRAEMEGGK